MEQSTKGIVRDCINTRRVRSQAVISAGTPRRYCNINNK